MLAAARARAAPEPPAPRPALFGGSLLPLCDIFTTNLIIFAASLWRPPSYILGTDLFLPNPESIKTDNFTFFDRLLIDLNSPFQTFSNGAVDTFYHTRQMIAHRQSASLSALGTALDIGKAIA